MVVVESTQIPKCPVPTGEMQCNHDAIDEVVKEVEVPSVDWVLVYDVMQCGDAKAKSGANAKILETFPFTKDTPPRDTVRQD